MNQLQNDDIYQEIAKITQKLDLLECYECVQAVMQWLVNNQIKGMILEIRTKNSREYFILSSRLERLGITESITVNGKHYGVEVRGRVFDNLSDEGMSRQEWLKDFQCPSQEFIVKELLEF